MIYIYIYIYIYRERERERERDIEREKEQEEEGKKAFTDIKQLLKISSKGEHNGDPKLILKKDYFSKLKILTSNA